MPARGSSFIFSSRLTPFTVTVYVAWVAVSQILSFDFNKYLQPQVACKKLRTTGIFMHVSVFMNFSRSLRMWLINIYFCSSTDPVNPVRWTVENSPSILCSTSAVTCIHYKKKKKGRPDLQIPHSSCLFLAEVFRSEHFCSLFSPHLSDLVSFNPPADFGRLWWPLLEWTGWISIHKSNSRVVSRSPTENLRSRQQPHAIQNVCPRKMQISTVWAVKNILIYILLYIIRNIKLTFSYDRSLQSN